MIFFFLTNKAETFETLLTPFKSENSGIAFQSGQAETVF